MRCTPVARWGRVAVSRSNYPAAGQRRCNGGQVHRDQPARHRGTLRAERCLRAVEGAYPREGHPRQHAVAGRPHPALAAREPGQGAQNAPALGAVGLVEHQVQRLRVGGIQRLGERRHEPAPGGGAAQVGHVHHAGHLVRADEAAKGRAHALVQCHGGVPAADHHDRVGAWRGGPVCPGAHAPPHPKRVHNGDAGAPVHQALDQALGGVGLARPRRAHEGQESVKNLGRYAASRIAWWPKRPSSTAALT